jgi:hypothetical protein
MEGVDRARELLWQESEWRAHLLGAEVQALRVRCMLCPPQGRGSGGGKDARHWDGYWRTAGAVATAAEATAARAARASSSSSTPHVSSTPLHSSSNSLHSSSTPHAAASSASSGRIHSAAQAAAGGCVVIADECERVDLLETAQGCHQLGTKGLRELAALEPEAHELRVVVCEPAEGRAQLECMQLPVTQHDRVCRRQRAA